MNPLRTLASTEGVTPRRCRCGRTNYTTSDVVCRDCRDEYLKDWREKNQIQSRKGGGPTRAQLDAEVKAWKVVVGRIHEVEAVSLDNRDRHACLISGIYFVKSSAYIKIGMATNVYTRVKGASLAWNPHDVTPLGWVNVPFFEDMPTLERRLHQQFAADHHRLEWFRASEALLAYVAENCLPWPSGPGWWNSPALELFMRSGAASAK